MTKWTVSEVSQATGISEGAISGYYSNRGVSTKGGLTLSQVLEVMHRNGPRGTGPDSDKVKLLVNILQAAGEDTPFAFNDNDEAE